MRHSPCERAAGDRAHQPLLRPLRTPGAGPHRVVGGATRAGPPAPGLRRRPARVRALRGLRRQARRRAGRLTGPMTGEPDRRDDGTPATPRAGRGRHRARRSRTRSVLLALLAVLVVVAGLAVGLGTLRVDTVAEDVDRVADPFPEEQDRPEVAETAEEARTFLVVGVDPADVATAATRAEAALLVRLTGDRRHAQVVTFPLDTWVAGRSTTLEGAFGTGGPQGVVGAVETLTDVRVDHYAELDYAGFASVTDALGGITVDVPQEYGNRGAD